MYSEVLDTIKTHDDLKILDDEIDLLISSLYEDHGGDFDKALNENVRADMSRIISDALLKSGVDREEFLRGLAKELGKYKVTKLTLAFEPTGRNIENISGWVRTNVGERIVLEIARDKSILAGAIISFGGEYRDLSFAGIFAEKFTRNLEKVRDILAS